MHLFDESFWFAVSFVLFVYFAYRPIRKAMLNALDSRISQIKAQMQEAEDIKNAAEELLKKAENEIKSLQSLQKEIMAKARQTAEELVAKQNAEFEMRLAHIQKAAEQDLVDRQEALLASAQKEIADKAVALVARYFQQTNGPSLPDIEIAKNIFPDMAKVK